MKRIVAVAIAAAFLSVGIAVAAEAPKGPVVMKSEKQGNVTFKHEGHKQVKCDACHGSADGGKIAGLDQKKGHAMCQKCHLDTAKADPSKKAISACTNCHDEKTKAKK